MDVTFLVEQLVTSYCAESSPERLASAVNKLRPQNEFKTSAFRRKKGKR